MPAQIPTNKPRLSSTEIRKYIDQHQVDRKKYPVMVVGIRGYYMNSMGIPGNNDRGIYDDALFIDTPSATASFNANTDPSVVRKGKGKGASKGMAKLKTGLWMAHSFGLHRGNYLALIQTIKEVTVIRDGNPDYEDTGFFGINIHKGGYNGTSSEGCQTIYPGQWDSFINLIKDQAIRYFGVRWNKVTIPYLLIENQGKI